MITERHTSLLTNAVQGHYGRVPYLEPFTKRILDYRRTEEVTLHYIILCYFNSSRFVSFRFISFHIMIMSCHIMIMSCHVTAYYVIQRHDMLHDLSNNKPHSV